MSVDWPSNNIWQPKSNKLAGQQFLAKITEKCLSVLHIKIIASKSAIGLTITDIWLKLPLQIWTNIYLEDYPKFIRAFSNNEIIVS